MATRPETLAGAADRLLAACAGVAAILIDDAPAAPRTPAKRKKR
jgi:hypothetical protein